MPGGDNLEGFGGLRAGPGGGAGIAQTQPGSGAGAHDGSTDFASPTNGGIRAEGDNGLGIGTETT